MRSTLWELRHGLTLLGLLVVFVVVAIRHPIFWSVPVGLTIIAVPILWAREKRSFRRRGYRVVWAGEGRSTYEEAVEGDSRSVELPSRWTEVGRPELFIPTRPEWEKISPEWAAKRRDSIFERVVAIWDGFEIHYPADWPPELPQIKSAIKP